MIGAIEFRTEQDPDVARYTHPKDISGAWHGMGAARICTACCVHPGAGCMYLPARPTSLAVQSSIAPLARLRQSCISACRCCFPATVMVVHASREAEQLRSQLLALIRGALQPLLRDRVG